MNPDNQIVLIVLLMAVLITALAINYYFHRRQEAENTRRLKSRQIKSQIERVLDVLTVLKQTSCNPQLISTLADHSVDLIAELKRLNPASDLAEQLQGNTAVATDTPLVIHSDHGIKHAQADIRSGTQILVDLKKSGRLTPLQFSEFNQELNWIHCLVEADAHIEHGNKLLEGNKTSVAISHYRQAKTALTKLGGKDGRKEQKLEQIKKLILDADPIRIDKSADNKSNKDESAAEEPQRQPSS
ncbi:MAG: hypothetical protein OQK12_10560 [Motiliproteus sp.]|nr:hypothetical protein [Motiliproteus sp.]MCW9051105.1 hypothetical protein [Motiliproteus sp.]